MTGVYLDWNATAPPRPEVLDAYMQASAAGWGNPASAHQWGQRARHVLDQARLSMALTLGCAVHELVLTSGGTEANATAIQAACREDDPVDHGRPRVVVSSIEHSSVLRPAKRWGRDCAIAGVDADGRILPASLESLVDASTRLVCLQLANNEIGTIQDLPALVALVRQRSPQSCILADCCQVPGRMPLPPLPNLGVDAASFAGHKLGAPKGLGLLWLRGGSLARPLLDGGRQQQDRRSGTEDAPGAVALACALAAATRDQDSGIQRSRGLLERLWARISQELPQAVWIARGAPRLANTMALGHPGCARAALVTRLDLAGYAVSPGAACMARRGDPSHVVAALGLDPALAASVIRISIGWSTTEAEIDGFAHAYVREVGSLRRTS